MKSILKADHHFINGRDSFMYGDNKVIRFYSSSYRHLFDLPDGGYISITRNDCVPDGETYIRQCHNYDGYFAYIGKLFYYLYDFALIMESIGAKYAPVSNPETFQGYIITERVKTGNQEYVMAHNPDAVSPYVTWQKYKSKYYDAGHFFINASEAYADLNQRTNMILRGTPYNYITNKQRKNLQVHELGR